MTIDPAAFAARSGPRYRALAETIAEDVRSGRLAAGARLPTQRELALRLGVTVGTVGRAYGLAEQQGWIHCEVGRGSFARPHGDDGRGLRIPEEAAGNLLDLRINAPGRTPLDAALAEALRALAGEARCLELLRTYAPGAGLATHRAAAAGWLGGLGVPADPSRIILTGGAQAGLHLSLSVLARPGETVLVEALAYPGLREIAEMLHLRLEPVALDADGMLPEALAEAAAAHPARAVVVVPDLHNPTSAQMPAARREALVAAAARAGLTLVEDAIYRPLTSGDAPALAALAPERTIHVASLSKGVVPGLRMGALMAPAPLVPALARAVHAVRVNESPLAGELLARWSAGGLLAEAAAAQRAGSAERQAVARARLAGLAFKASPGALHLWLELPPGRTAREAERSLEAQGVLVAPAELFSFGRGPAPEALRLALGRPRTVGELDRALTLVAQTLLGAPTPRGPVV
jgi:DNA-binding transcriptional MocR family regulator